MPRLDIGNRLYHYCDLSTAIEYILPNFKLRLSPITKTNDPRENQSFNFSHRDKELSIEEMLDLNKEYSEILRNDCKVLCFSEDSSESTLPGRWGCLLSNMWAYYGDNHKGVCLELNKELFIKENNNKIDFDYFMPVDYLNYKNLQTIRCEIEHKKIKEEGKEKYLLDLLKKEKDFAKYLFFTKNSEWQSEQETRLVHFSNKKTEEYCSINNSLTNIILGINFNENHRPSIEKLISKKNIDILDTKYTEILAFKTLWRD